MRVVFARIKGQQDVVKVERGGVERSFPLNRYEGAPPELLHYVVETKAGLRQGFWGMVADGVAFEDAYLAGQGSRGSLGGRDTKQVRLASVLVAGFHHEAWMGGGDDRSYASFVRDGCVHAQIEYPDWLDDDRISDLRDAVDDASSRWRSLSETDSLVAHYPGSL